MVFSNLSSSEKDAFFSLLDEYFASRPDVFGSAAGGAPAASVQPARPIPVNPAGLKNAASAIHNAFTSQSNHSSESASSEPAWKRNNRNPSPQPPSTSDTMASSMGRVAAAAAMFKSNPPAAMGAPPPRPPPRRTSSTASPPLEEEEHPSPPLPSRTPSSSSASKLVAQKKFGDVDMTSGKNMYMSIRHGTANKSAAPQMVAPPVPAALPQIRKDFGPPPVRRAPSTTNVASENARSAPPPPPPRPAQEEPEPDGEWAEAIYEYSSEDPGDLQLQEGQRVLVIERTSDDWWTAEFQGRRGLVPASYMKVL